MGAKLRRGASRKSIDVKSLREILMPVYYRHEFARRNELVATDGARIFGDFPLASGFLQKKGYIYWPEGREPETFANLLIKEYALEHDLKKKTAMKDSLLGFVPTRHVMPVLPMPHPFFPKEMACPMPEEVGDEESSGRKKDVAKMLYVIWRSLVDFERFILFEGIVSEPCFMPVVPLNRFQGTKGLHDADNKEACRLLECRILIAVDGCQPTEAVKNNLQVLLDHLDVLDNIKMDETADGSSRIHWLPMEKCLRAFDASKANPSKADKELAIDIYKPRRKRRSKHNEDTLLANATSSFSRWLDRANTLISDYHHIT